MLSNLEIIGWKNFRGQPKLDKATGQVQFACQRNFLNPTISKLDKHVVLLLIKYIAREVIQLCKENYSNCLWRKTDWALDLPKLGKASKISGDLWRSPEIVISLWKSWEVFGWSAEIFGSVQAIFGSTQVIFRNLLRCSGDIRKSSEVFGWSSEVFGIVRLIFGNLQKCSGDLRKSSGVFGWSSEIFGSVQAIFGSTQVIFRNLLRCSGDIRKSSEVFGW